MPTECPSCRKPLQRPDACGYCDWQRSPDSTDRPPPRLHDELAVIAAECRDLLDRSKAWPSDLSRVPERTVSDFLLLVEPQDAVCRLVSVNGSGSRWDCPGIVSAGAMLRTYLLGGARLQSAVAWGAEHGIRWRGDDIDSFRNLVKHVSDNPAVKKRPGEQPRDYGKRILAWCRAHGSGAGQRLPYDPTQSLSGDPVGGSRAA